MVPSSGELYMVCIKAIVRLQYVVSLELEWGPP